MQRSRDWFHQSTNDLEAAKVSLDGKKYEWTCFQAHQCVEKGLKALLMTKNVEVWGHSLLILYRNWIEISGESESSKTTIKIQELDRHYIQARYPNGYSEGYPAMYYNIEVATKSVEYATEIYHYIKERI